VGAAGTSTGARRGRPKASSKAMLEDAAFELFLEQSYARTTVEQIALRAGVSRNTFFNYFESKSDVFWVDLDERLTGLRAALEATSPDRPVLDAVRDAIVGIGSSFGPARVPWMLTQHELIGSVHELQASALGRLTTQADVIEEFLAERSARPVSRLISSATAYAVIGAAVAGTRAWAAAGTTRGELVPYLEEALAPVVAGFAPLY
jgi:AcrR family transcriptional regulator